MCCVALRLVGNNGVFVFVRQCVPYCLSRRSEGVPRSAVEASDVVVAARLAVPAGAVAVVYVVAMINKGRNMLVNFVRVHKATVACHAPLVVGGCNSFEKEKVAFVIQR